MENGRKSKLDKILDRSSKVFAVLGGFAMIWVTYHFSQVATKLSEQGILVSEEQRKGVILPNIEVLSSINYTEDYEEITVPFRNLGPGKAIRLRALVSYDGEIQGEAFHLFQTFSKTSRQSGKVLQNPIGSQQDLFTLGPVEGKDWIDPYEVLYFRFSPWLNKERPTGLPETGRNFTFFISYFDIDANEYLFVTKLPIGGRSGLILIAGGKSGLNDSLLRLAQPVEIFTQQVYNNINLRTKNGYFRNFGSNVKQIPIDSTQYEDSLIE